MSTRCKFKCDAVTDFGATKSVVLSAVVNGSDENKKFWAYTPTGTISFTTVNKDLDIQAGKEYYIDITEVEGA